MSVRSLWARGAVTPDGETGPTRIVFEDGRITCVEAADEAAPGDDAFPDATLLPGLIDLQVNGAAGMAFSHADARERRFAVDYHLARGTTGLLAALVTAPLEQLQASLARLAEDVSDDGPLLGIHVEGPFLSEEKAGAHARQWLCDPTPGAVEGLLAHANGRLRMLTLAPELPGALEAIARLRAAGVVAAAGHSVATREQLRCAIEAGLDFVTHVGNSSDWPSRPYDSKLRIRRSEPGVVGSFLVEERLRGSLILDGLHLDTDLAAAIVRLRGTGAVALVSDATPAAGLPPGPFAIGGLEGEITPEGYATTGEGLAGSTITLLDAVRVAVERSCLSLVQAVTLASRTPASVLGLLHKGALAPGCSADLLLLGSDWQPHAVYLAGRRI